MRAELTLPQSTDLQDGGGATQHVPWTSFHRSPLNDRIRDSVHFAIFMYQHCIHDSLSATIFGTHYLDRYGTDSKLFFFTHPTPGGVPEEILGGQQFKSPGNVMNSPENQSIVL